MQHDNVVYCDNELLSLPHAGYSPGNMPRAGYLVNNEGGECLDGYKMAMNIQSLGDNRVHDYALLNLLINHILH